MELKILTKLIFGARRQRLSKNKNQDFIYKHKVKQDIN